MAKAVSCPRCNKRLPEEAKFCRRCGTGMRGRSAPPLPPPLVWTGYDAAAGRQGRPREHVSPPVHYEAGGRRHRQPPNAAPPRAVGFSVPGWALFLLLGVFAFRACDLHSTKGTSSPGYRSTPRMRSAPRHEESPPVRDGGARWADDHGRGVSCP